MTDDQTNDDQINDDQVNDDQIAGAADVDDAAVAPTAATAPTPPPAGQAARRSGRPILGAIAGFLLGLFLWIDLVLVGVVRLESVTFWVFPILGLAAGIGLARWAPLGRRGG